MNYSTLLRFVFAFVFVCLTSAVAAAQDTGISGYTSIDYDEETNTVMAYAETTLNYDLMTDYRGEIWLTVTKSSGGYAANGGTLDDGNGFAAIELSFAGEPGETYTAVGNHRARLQMWDYVDTFPYERFYYDNWYFTGFEAQSIYQPWYHYFGSPGNYVYRRRDDIVSMGRTFDSLSIINPKVIINGPPTAMDGETVQFSVTVQNNPQDNPPTGYLWSFEPTSGGNNPQVNFTPSNAATTQAKAHWFAKPDTPCTYSDSTYTIKVAVTFKNRRRPITGKAPFTVSIGSNWGGGVDPPSTDAPIGTLDVAYDNQRELWVVVGPKDLKRVPSLKTVRTPQNSQFYNKSVKHEEVHEKQYVDNGIFSDLYQIDDVMPRLLLLADPDKQALEAKAFKAVQDWRAEQFQILRQRNTQSEIEAHAVSDLIAPKYIFQLQCMPYGR